MTNHQQVVLMQECWFVRKDKNAEKKCQKTQVLGDTAKTLEGEGEGRVGPPPPPPPPTPASLLFCD